MNEHEVRLLKNYSQVYKQLLTCTKNEQTAEDLVQETYLRALRHIRNRGPPRRAEPWLSSIARNAAADHFRHRRGEYCGEELLEPLADERDDPLEIMVRADEAEQMQTARGYLQPSDQEVLDRFYWQDESCNQIGLEQGTSGPVMKVRLWRARQRLKEFLTSPYMD